MFPLSLLNAFSRFSEGFNGQSVIFSVMFVVSGAVLLTWEGNPTYRSNRGAMPVASFCAWLTANAPIELSTQTELQVHKTKV